MEYTAASWDQITKTQGVELKAVHRQAARMVDNLQPANRTTGGTDFISSMKWGVLSSSADTWQSSEASTWIEWGLIWHWILHCGHQVTFTNQVAPLYLLYQNCQGLEQAPSRQRAPGQARRESRTATIDHHKLLNVRCHRHFHLANCLCRDCTPISNFKKTQLIANSRVLLFNQVAACVISRTLWTGCWPHPQNNSQPTHEQRSGFDYLPCTTQSGLLYLCSRPSLHWNIIL